eukprot:scaffold478553_cov13-Prasinocladus_malaysianus.AAC.1
MTLFAIRWLDDSYNATSNSKAHAVDKAYLWRDMRSFGRDVRRECGQRGIRRQCNCHLSLVDAGELPLDQLLVEVADVPLPAVGVPGQNQVLLALARLPGLDVFLVRLAAARGGRLRAEAKPPGPKTISESQPRQRPDSKRLRQEANALL